MHMWLLLAKYSYNYARIFLIKFRRRAARSSPFGFGLAKYYAYAPLNCINTNRCQLSSRGFYALRSFFLFVKNYIC